MSADARSRTLRPARSPSPPLTPLQRYDPDMEPGHWVTGSMGHLGHLSRPGHRVIILSFSGFRKHAQNAKRTLEMLK